MLHPILFLEFCKECVPDICYSCCIITLLYEHMEKIAIPLQLIVPYSYSIFSCHQQCFRETNNQNISRESKQSLSLQLNVSFQ